MVSVIVVNNNEKTKRIPNIMGESDEPAREHLGMRKGVAGSVIPHGRPEYKVENTYVQSVTKVQCVRSVPVQILMGSNQLEQCNIL